MVSKEQGLRDHLGSRITNASDTCSKIFHRQTASWRGEGKEGGGKRLRERGKWHCPPRLVAAGPGGSGRPDPAPRRGWAAGPGTSQLSLRGRVALRPLPDTHFGAAPAPAPRQPSPASVTTRAGYLGAPGPGSCGPGAGGRR